MRDNGELSLRVTKLNRLIESRYGLDLLDYQGQPGHLQQVCEHYREKYEVIKRVLGEDAITFSADAARAYLISEAARMLLREIAPKRLKKRKGK